MGMENIRRTTVDKVNPRSDRLQHAINHALESEASRVIPTSSKVAHIYLIRCGHYYKVGSAMNVKKRVALLQTGNPKRITLVESWQSLNALQEERRIHVLLRAYRVRGEWFKLPKAMVDRL